MHASTFTELAVDVSQAPLPLHAVVPVVSHCCTFCGEHVRGGGGDRGKMREPREHTGHMRYGSEAQVKDKRCTIRNNTIYTCPSVYNMCVWSVHICARGVCCACVPSCSLMFACPHACRLRGYSPLAPLVRQALTTLSFDVVAQVTRAQCGTLLWQRTHPTPHTNTRVERGMNVHDTNLEVHK